MTLKKKNYLLWLAILLGLLLLVGVDQYMRHRRAIADLAGCRRQLERLASAVESHTRLHGRPPETLDRLVPRSLPALPTCPAAAEETYSSGFKATRRADGTWVVVIACGGGHHRRFHDATNFPSRELKVQGFEALPKPKSALGR